MTQDVVYHICPAEAWAVGAEAGEYAGTDADLLDGFIHLSTRDQVVGAAARHFAGEDGLVLLTIDYAAIETAVRWEDTAALGELFPHLYGALPVSAVRAVAPLPLDAEDGRHVFPFPTGNVEDHAP